jgi:hypothetical protein
MDLNISTRHSSARNGGNFASSNRLSFLRDRHVYWKNNFNKNEEKELRSAEVINRRKRKIRKVNALHEDSDKMKKASSSGGDIIWYFPTKMQVSAK